jgi:hypothetical protein
MFDDVLTYGVMVDVVMLSYRTCLSKDCLLIIIVHVVLGVLLSLMFLGWWGVEFLFIRWGPGFKDPGCQGPRDPGPLGPGPRC